MPAALKKRNQAQASKNARQAPTTLNARLSTKLAIEPHPSANR